MTSSQGTVASRQRELWVDNLRVAVIAGVIVAHTATGYLVDIAGWYYDDERIASGLWSTVLAPPMLLGVLFALGPLFLLGGWFAARSLGRRGPGGFVRSRLLRLGLPIVAFLLVVNPLADYLGNLRDERRSLLAWLGTTEVGVMWFATALLAFSVAYAALRHLRPAAGPRRSLRPGALAAAAAAIAVTSFAVWQVWPLTTDTYLNLKLGEWPQGAVLFALGVRAGEAGSPPIVPPAQGRRLGQVAVVGLAAFLALLGLLVLGDGADDAVVMSAGLPTMLFALVDGVLAVTWTLWFVAWLHRRWPRHGAVVGTAARASYATYVIHPLVLTVLMLLLAVVPLPPEAKFLLVAVAGVPVCFTAGYLLTRLPAVSTVL